MALFSVECSSEWWTAEPHGGFWIQSESSDVRVEDVLAKGNRQKKAGKQAPTAWEGTLRSLTVVSAFLHGFPCTPLVAPYIYIC